MNHTGEQSNVGGVVTRACPFGDPTCPCQDGDACHYVDTPTTKAWPAPTEEKKRFWAEQGRP